jgi:broad specificity phosphatase PhoE
MKLYLIRHGVSCTNLLRAQGRTLEADQYIDPELTQEGRRTAELLRPLLLKKLKKPYIVGASILLRAQQTAHLLLKPEQILIVPHISELMRTSLECTAMMPDLQARTLEQTGDNTLVRDFTYMEPEVPEEDQVNAFLHWLATTGAQITDNGKKRLVLVSHGLFIETFLHQTLKKHMGPPLNYQVFEIDIQLKGARAIVKKVRTIPYTSKKRLQMTVKKYMRNNRCRYTYKKGS